MWVSKGYKPFGRVQRQRLWWGVGQSPTSKKTSKASEAMLYEHSTPTPLGLSYESFIGFFIAKVIFAISTQRT